MSQMLTLPVNIFIFISISDGDEVNRSISSNMYTTRQTLHHVYNIYFSQCL